MKLTKEELLSKVKAEHETPTEEGYISLLEDISDSIIEACELTATIEALTAQVEELKQKYIDRFFTTEETEETEETEGTTEEPEEVEIEELFEEVE